MGSILFTLLCLPRIELMGCTTILVFTLSSIRLSILRPLNWLQTSCHLRQLGKTSCYQPTVQFENLYLLVRFLKGELGRMPQLLCSKCAQHRVNKLSLQESPRNCLLYAGRWGMEIHYILHGQPFFFFFDNETEPIGSGMCYRWHVSQAFLRTITSHSKRCASF